MPRSRWSTTTRRSPTASCRARVAERGDELDLDARSLVVLTGDRSIEFVISYLALLDRGHVPLLAGDHVNDLAASWDAAAVVDANRESLDIVRRRHEPATIHPDLALLLSTSGSTGSPKLVRLSHTNLSSNASAIADYLDLSGRDRGISSLPFHYCYGLSVLHSHLLVGATRGDVRCIGRRPVFPERTRTARGDERGRGTAHVRPARSCGTGSPLRPVVAVRDPGRWPAGARGGSPLDQPVGDSRRRLLRDVRPDRGHGAHGVPASRGRRPPSRERSVGRFLEDRSRSARSMDTTTTWASWSTAGRT